MQYFKKQNKYAIAYIVLLFFSVPVLSIFLSSTSASELKNTGSIATSTDAVFNLTHADVTADIADDQSVVSVDLSSLTDREYVISEEGDYELSGTFRGKLTVSAEEKVVHIILAGVDIASSNGPALEVQSAAKVIITVTEGTENKIMDSGNYKDTEAEGCIYSSCDLTINGMGKLNVYGYYKDAVYSKDIVKVIDADLFIQSKRNAIRGNDGILVATKLLSIESEGNGLKTTKTGKGNKGVIDVCAGKVSVIAGNSAFVTPSDIYVRNSSVYAKSIVSDFDVGGECHIEEGCFGND